MDPKIYGHLKDHIVHPDPRIYKTGTVLFRGGETQTNAPIHLVRTNIFFSLYSNATLDYTKFWMLHPNCYVTRCHLSRDTLVLSVGRQLELCAKIMGLLGWKGTAHTFQRDRLIDLYRNIVGNSLDGLDYPDDELTELLIDNSAGILVIDDQAVYHRENPDWNAINRVLRRHKKSIPEI